MNIRRAQIGSKGAVIALRLETGHATAAMPVRLELDAAMALHIAAKLIDAVRAMDGADLAMAAGVSELEEALRFQQPLPELFPTQPKQEETKEV